MTEPTNKNPIYRWTRLTSPKWEDAWAERLTFLGPGKVAFIQWPGGRSVRMEAFVDEVTAKLLSRAFGGSVTKASQWTGDKEVPRKPLKIRSRLTIYPDPTGHSHHPADDRTHPILIPAGMAFGTGDHATTASCLRMLCDIAPSKDTSWTALDVGTGSGILAIAAGALGASEVEAFDFDATAVRVARANIRANGFRQVKVFRADVTTWTPSRTFDVVLANLFSELLIRSLETIKSSINQGGHLIVSGVLQSQLAEVLEAAAAHNLETLRSVVRGKWSAALLRNS